MTRNPATSTPAQDRVQDAAARPVLPNCDHAEFDEDGDCAKCREPEVVPAAAGA